MKTIAIAVALLLCMSPALARAQGSAVPGVVAPSSARQAHVEVTFTKWTVGAYMEGITGGAAPGVFAGEVLQRQVSTNPAAATIIRLEAVYEVHAGDHSFTALIRGGQSGDTTEALGIGRLDGVILTGWRAGARVQVTFQKVASCAGKPAGPCFEGSIQVEHAPNK